MMRPSAFFKPEYLLRPTQLARRFYRLVFRPRADRLVVHLPWRWPIAVDPNDEIGKALLQLGVYDLAVSEVLWRLCDEGETALDIGANVGYMTALLAKRVGARGKVLSFEANPQVATELQDNVVRWSALLDPSVFQVFTLALSDFEGSVSFELPSGYSHNRMLGRVVDEMGIDSSNLSSFSVPCSTLDRCLNSSHNVGVAKMDVEGHEEKVLRGSQQTLKNCRVRDWVFEHPATYPSELTNLFEDYGYNIFQIEKQFSKPALVEGSKPIARFSWMPQSFLATLDSERALTRIKPRGWRCLG